MHPRALFEEKVEVGPGCWTWRGTRSSTGYGVMHWDGRLTGAHRIAWTLIHEEEIPAGMVVRHTCDNRPCVRPDHLLIGTRAENSRDMVERGRSTRKTHCKRGHLLSETRRTWGHTTDCLLCVRVRATNQRARRAA